MKICYLLEGTDLWGGVKVVLEQANELHRRGMTVTILAKGPKPDWYPVEAPFRQVPEFSRRTIPQTDFIVATFWTTVPPAVYSDRGTVVHFCQGYEGLLSHYHDRIEEIEYAYHLDTLKITVSPHLVDLIRNRFDQDAACIGQTLNHRVFYPAKSSSFPAIPRIILVGIYECDSKGIVQGLQALAMMKRKGVPFEIVRVSQFPRTPDEEAYCLGGTYRVKVPPLEMADLYRSCHIALSPAREAEGFGLPALEALACSLPSVLTRTPSHLNLDPTRNYALFVPADSPEPMAEALTRLIRDAGLRKRLSARAGEVALNYSTSRATSRLVDILSTYADNRSVSEYVPPLR